MKKPQKSAGASRKAESGNVVVDLGEKLSRRIDTNIERKLAAAGLAGAGRTQVGRPGPSRSGGRPGMFGGGYRPWYSRFGRPWLGNSASMTVSDSGNPLGALWGAIVPAHMRQVATSHALTGVALGVLGNRAVMRLTPWLMPTQKSLLLHEGIAFVAGLIPLLFKRNAMTLGVAIPGGVYLVGSLVDSLFNWAGLPPQTLSGAVVQQRPQGADAFAARQKLAAVQNRINAQASGAQRPLPRVVAQQYA